MTILTEIYYEFVDTYIFKRTFRFIWAEVSLLAYVKPNKLSKQLHFGLSTASMHWPSLAQTDVVGTVLTEKAINAVTASRILRT